MKDQTQDFMKILRTNFRRKSGQCHDDRRILYRTKSTMLLDNMKIPGERFYRDRDQQDLAFFTPDMVPYRPLGDPCLDTFGLVINCMKDCLSEQAIADAVRLQEARGFRKYDSEQKNDQAKTQKGFPLPVLKETLRNRHLASKTAGKQVIGEILLESENRLKAVRAGQAFIHNFLEYHSKKALERLRDEDEVHASEAVAIKNFSSHYLLHAIGTTNDAVPINGKAAAESPRGDSPRLTCTKVDTPQEDPKIANFFQKLDTIYTILSMISNMTPRHLKQTVPLDREQVKQLKRCPFSRLPAINNSSRDLPKGSCSFRQPDFAETNMVKAKSKKNGPGSVTSVTPCTSNSSIKETQAQGGDFRSAVKRISSKRVLRSVQNSSTNRRGQRSISAARGEPKTWEDMMKGPRRKGSAKPRMPKWFYLTQEKLVPIKDDTNSEIVPLDLLPDHFPTGTSDRYKAKYIIANEKLQNTAEKSVAKHIEQRLKIFQLRWNSLLLPNPKNTWKQQRAIMNKFNGTEEKNQRDHHFLCPWFDALNAEAVLLYNSLEPRVEETLERMSTFVKANIEHVSNGKEKLCLVTFSLPYYEIKQPGMQAAIKFVLTKVFKQREEMFDLWLNERNI